MPGAAGELFQEIEDAYGVPGILVNNAGIYEARDFLDYDAESYGRVFDINAGAAFCTRALARRLIAAGRPGSVINVASISGQSGSPEAAYGASKTSTERSSPTEVVSRNSRKLATSGIPHAPYCRSHQQRITDSTTDTDTDTDTDMEMKDHSPMDSTPTGARTLTVTIDARLSERVPGYVLGLIAVPDIDVVKDAPAVAAQLTAAEDDLHAAQLSKAEVSALPAIAAWRDAYRAVDVNPNRFLCAAESVLRRVAKGDRLPRINSLVDLCNATSLDSRLPVASCDVGDIEGELDVRLAHGGETYLPLGAPDAPEQPEPGEVVYADGQGRAHSRRWNWRQGDVVKTELGPRRILLTVESAHEGGRDDVERALGRLTEALAGLCVESGRPLVLDRSTPSGELFGAWSAATVH